MGATVVAAPSAGDGGGHLSARVGLDLEAQVRSIELETPCMLFTTKERELGMLFEWPIVSLPLSPTPTPSQADAAALERLYESMALETETLGLDSNSIRCLWSFYRCVPEEAAGEKEEGGGGATGRKQLKKKAKPEAKKYSEFSPPLAPAAIRLLLFFLDGRESDSDPGVDLLRAAGDAAVTAALAALEELDGEEEEEEEEEVKEKGGHNGREMDNNERSSFPSLASAFHATPGRHMTVFQASHPASIVPDSTSLVSVEDGEGEKEAEEGGNNNDEGALFGKPPEGALAREIAAAREAALAVGAPPRLVADRVFLARSGALLLTLTEEAAGEEKEGEKEEERRRSGGRVAALRKEAALRMPRASKRQPAILHVTLGRLLAPLPSVEAAARVSKAAEEAAEPFLIKARESRKAWVPSFLAHVVEDTFASVDGESVLLPFS